MTDDEDQQRRAYLDGLARFFEEKILFNAFLGMKVEELGEGYARLRVPFREELMGDPFRPAMHGGVLSTIADTAGGVAAFTAVEPGDRVSTVDLRIDYLRPAGRADVIAEARVLRIGNRVAVSDIVVHQGDPGRHVATGKGVYNIKRVES